MIDVKVDNISFLINPALWKSNGKKSFNSSGEISKETPPQTWFIQNWLSWHYNVSVFSESIDLKVSLFFTYL